MKVAVCYVHPNLKPLVHVPAARRFVASYLEHPPGECDHDLWVLVNGRPLEEGQQRIFEPLAVQYFSHDNSGKDIGAFQQAAAQFEACDLMVCLGSFVNFHWTGWLDRLARVFLEHGPALYGCWGFPQPRVHIRTTAFWLPPALLASYPRTVVNGSRYEFEHGKTGILPWVSSLGLPAWQVTRREVLPREEWRPLKCGECLLLDQHTEKMGFQQP
jgi:hypothetical protein